jgi:hypothetical protein
MSISHHDAYRQIGTPANLSYSASGGTSQQSSAFGSQTYWIRVCAVGNTATNAGVRIKVGDNPTAAATSVLLPLNWVEVIRCTPGQKIAALGNDATAGTLSITELSD